MTDKSLFETYAELLSLVQIQHQHAEAGQWLDVVKIQSRYILTTDELVSLTDLGRASESSTAQRERMEVIEHILSIQSQTKRLLQQRQAEIVGLMLEADRQSSHQRMGKLIDTGTYQPADIRKSSS